MSIIENFNQFIENAVRKVGIKNFPINSIELAKQQQDFLINCIEDNLGSKIYNNLKLTYDAVNVWKGYSPVNLIESMTALLGINQDIVTYIDEGGLTREEPIYIGRTSGTSDGNTGGKNIPITEKSLEMGEKDAMKNTLMLVVKKTGIKNIAFGKAMVMSASFDGKKWYISGIMNHYASLFRKRLLYPPASIIGIANREEKKKAIINDLKSNPIYISSVHGVAARPLEVLTQLKDTDPALAKEVLQHLCYVSIGGGPPLDYKQRYKQLLESLWINQSLCATNNHNATEGFFWSQLRNFDNLDFHWMTPHIWGNWFGYITVSEYNEYIYNQKIPHVLGLHEVIPHQEYIQITLNHRIPVPYIVKDIVTFNEEGEYLVTGRIGMASNVANEHIEQKHVLECLTDLHVRFPALSDYNAIAGMELDNNHKLTFHRLIESQDPTNNDISTISSRIHEWFIAHHEQYKWFAEKWKIIWCKVKLVWVGEITDHLRKLGKWHEQSKIPHIGNTNYEEIIAKYTIS